MKATYDSETDALYVRFAETTIVDSDEVAHGVILDFDSDGKIVAVEFLEASKHITAGAEFPTNGIL